MVNGANVQFKPGEAVQLSEAARLKAKRPERRGVVIGFSRTGNQVRVRWNGLMTTQMIHHSLLVAAGRSE